MRDLGEIALKHRAIAGEAERPTIVARVVANEPWQARPILLVETGDIGSVEVGEGGFGHRIFAWGWEEEQIRCAPRLEVGAAQGYWAGVLAEFERS